MYVCILYVESSYGTARTSSSTPDDRTISSVVHNSSSDKEENQEQQQTEDNSNSLVETNNNINHSDSEKVIETASPHQQINLSGDKNLETFESALYNSTAVDNLFVQNNNNNHNFHPTVGIISDNPWPYDLSRSTGGDTSAYHQSASNFYSATNFRNHHYSNSFYNQSVAAAMKGKLMTLTPSSFNNPLSPPSSSSSSSTSDSSSEMSYACYYGQDNNNSSSFINYHENNNNNSITSQTNHFLDDFCEILKEENYYSSVEDSGHYTTLQNASTGGSFDMYLDTHIPRHFGHQHSTSSGDSRSPSDAFNPTDDYDNGMQNFTQLTQLTTRSNGLYASSPITDGMISNYDSTTHGITSNR